MGLTPDSDPGSGHGKVSRAGIESPEGETGWHGRERLTGNTTSERECLGIDFVQHDEGDSAGAVVPGGSGTVHRFIQWSAT